MNREDQLEAALKAVRLGSLLNVRRAAFAPDIGVRYTEAIRSDIEREVRALEDYIDSALAQVRPGRPTGEGEAALRSPALPPETVRAGNTNGL